MNAWPTFHRDGTVTVHGDRVGVKLSHLTGGYSFACDCGASSTRLTVRELRKAVAHHLETQAHLDSAQGVTS